MSGFRDVKIRKIQADGAASARRAAEAFECRWHFALGNQFVRPFFRKTGEGTLMEHRAQSLETDNNIPDKSCGTTAHACTNLI